MRGGGAAPLPTRRRRVVRGSRRAGRGSRAPCRLRCTSSHAPRGLSKAEVVDALLESVRGANRGVGVPEAKRRLHRELIDELVDNRGGAAESTSEGDMYINDPRMFGLYDVVLTVPGPEQRDGEPAGGAFRGRLGRALFRTTAVMQSITEPATVVNEVRFRLFGALPGRVSLTGTFSKLDEERQCAEDGTHVFANEPDALRIDFRRPAIELGSWFRLHIGPPSSVVLQTTYLDDRIRLGKGGRGSIFVFERIHGRKTFHEDEGSMKNSAIDPRVALAAVSAALVIVFRGTLRKMPVAFLASALTITVAGVLWKRRFVIGGGRAPDEETHRGVI